MNSPFYLGAAATSTLYALVLEAIGKEHYEPDYTVVTVAAGVALTGGWVALRLAMAPLPNLQGRALAWWVWRQVLWMFVATGSPITIWQVWQSRQRIVGLLDYQVRTHYVHLLAELQIADAQQRLERIRRLLTEARVGVEAPPTS